MTTFNSTYTSPILKIRQQLRFISYTSLPYLKQASEEASIQVKTHLSKQEPH